MLEQLSGVLAGETYASTDIKTRANGLAARAAAELASLGVTLTADTGTATTVTAAIGTAKSTVNAQALTATFGKAQQGQALGRLDALGAQLASLGLT